MADMVYLKHAVTGGGTWVPDDEGVLEAHRVRGWKPADPPPGAERDRPDAESLPATRQWVRLVHPETGGEQLLPNHPDAMAEAEAKGWRFPEELEDDSSSDDADTESDGGTESKRTTRKSTAKASSTRAADENKE